VNADLILFSLTAVAAVGTALLTVLLRNPVMSAISLIANFFCIALLYLFLQAQLLAVLQIVVYTGAIMVLVVFVIMLLNLGKEEGFTERYDLKKIAGAVLAAGFVLEMLYIFFSDEESLGALTGQTGVDTGSVEAIGASLFGTFLLPFEVTSLLLLVAIIGAVVLARRRA
jgi:NADH-quinone oxidoreductase subunit J